MTDRATIKHGYMTNVGVKDGHRPPPSTTQSPPPPPKGGSAVSPPPTNGD